MSVRRLDPVQPTEPFIFTTENLAWAKKTIAQYPAGKQASAVIALLWRAQEQNQGWLSQPAMEYVGQMLNMAYIRVYEVATFYTMFQLSPVGKTAHIQVCGTTPCMLRGAEDLKQVCRNRIHHHPHHLSEDGNFSWEEVECLGACVNAPMVQVWKDTYEDLTPESLEKLIDDMAAGRAVKPGPQNGRQQSMPLGGPTALTDASLYDRPRKFERVEAPAPAAAPTATPAATPAAAPAAPVAALAPAAPVGSAPANPVPALVITPLAAEGGQISLKTTAPAKVVSVEAKPAAVETKPAAVEAKPAAVKVAKPIPVAQPVSDAKMAGAPELLKAARGGKADDLKLIWGVGPALERMLNKMGVWHFEQIASWSATELKWVDNNLEGFKGRAKRDEWIKQAKKLAKGWRPEHAQGDKPKGRG